MKKLLSLLLSCALTALLSLSAYADAPALSGVYAAPRVENASGENGDTEPAASLLYIYDDGSWKQYDIHNGTCELSEEGQGGYGGGADPAGLGFVRLYPQPEAAPPAPTPAAPRPAPVVYESGGELYYDEGTAGIRITGYTKYSGESSFRFPSAGDKVAVISPSALPGAEQTAATAAGLRSWGFEPVEGRHVYGEVRTLEECLEDFRWALEDPEIKAIFCVRGGYGATEVMDALEDGLIEAAGKPIIGYSDITVYHGAWTRAGLPSVHACMSGTFDDFPEECAEAEKRMMTGEIPAYACEADAYCRAGTAEGILIGGNLSTVAAALDTAYDSTGLDRPYILFLEEVGENMQHIHRYLTILKHKGVLDKAAGIIFGEWTELPADGTGNYGEARGRLFDSVEDMIARQFLADLDVPVAFGFPAGHGEMNYPLLMGAAARLEVTEGSYTLSWPMSEKA